MTSAGPQRVEMTIRRLTKQIDALSALFYGSHKQSDRFLYAAMLEHRLDDFVRAAVLQMHTAIENLLTGAIGNELLGVRPRQRKAKSRAVRTVRGRASVAFLEGPTSLGFAQKVRLASALGIVTTRVAKELEELNKIRNACSHHWLLNVRIRRNRRRHKPKPPLVSYHGRSLHQTAVFDDFLGEYSGCLLAALRVL